MPTSPVPPPPAPALAGVKGQGEAGNAPVLAPEPADPAGAISADPAAPAHPVPAPPAGKKAEEELDDAPPLESFQKLLASLGVRLHLPERLVEVEGWVNMQRGLVEVFACAPDGKTHESVLVLDCVPSALNSALLALNFKSGEPARLGGDGDSPLGKPPAGDPVYIYVRWRNSGGQVLQARAEDWIWNRKGDRPMQRMAWVYTGSYIQEVSQGEAGTYAADYIKTLVATFNDPTSIIDNPLPSGRDDTLFYVNEKVVPDPRTPVTVIFSPLELPAR